MAVITCPECGGKVSTTAEVCPHCGWPIAKAIEAARQRLAERRASWPAPIDPSWTKRWEKRLLVWRIVFSIVPPVFFGLGILFSFLGGSAVAFAVPSYLLAALTFIKCLALLLLGEVKTREYDGYTVLVYKGMMNCLVVEGVVQTGGVIARYLGGRLPNGVEVRVGITAWHKTIKIDIGDEHTFRW